MSGTIGECEVVVVQDLGRVWPLVNTIGLSQSDVRRRKDFIGGSDANRIMSGDDEKLLDLWRIKRGVAEDAVPRTLALVMGSWTEELNRQWFEQETGMPVGDAGLVAVSDVHGWRSATLDGVVEERGAVWEAKHVSAFARSEEVLQRYMPQLQHNMAVTAREHAILSVFYGNHRWEVTHVAADWLYQEELLEAEMRFWACVRSGEPPAALPAPPTPRAFGVKEVSFEGNNRWASASTDWLAHAAAAKLHAAASKDLKELVTDDTSRAYGHNVEIRRSRAGALTIRELVS